MMLQEPEEQDAGIETGIADKEEVEELKQAQTEERQKAETYLSNWQRAQADFINYKRHSEQEKKEINQSARSLLMLSLLPVLDDLERAFASIPSDLDNLSWTDGIKLIEHKLRISLEAQGLSTIQAMGEPFDPNFHEAIRRGKGKDGIIVEELQRGYQLHDRVLRPTMVVVGEGETKKKRKSDSEESETPL